MKCVKEIFYRHFVYHVTKHIMITLNCSVVYFRSITRKLVTYKAHLNILLSIIAIDLAPLRFLANTSLSLLHPALTLVLVLSVLLLLSFVTHYNRRRCSNCSSESVSSTTANRFSIRRRSSIAKLQRVSLEGSPEVTNTREKVYLSELLTALSPALFFLNHTFTIFVT